jgi:hypothetical protein
MSERSNDYPTGDPSGMSFICNRWTFTGPEGYRVVPDGTAFQVVRYDATGTSPTYLGQNLTEDEAHDMAARLSRR